MGSRGSWSTAGEVCAEHLEKYFFPKIGLQFDLFNILMHINYQ